MIDELLDLVDQNDNIIGTILKSIAHQDPTKIHREVSLIIFNNKGQALIQQRSLNKKNDPGIWTVTANGHVGVGENPEQAIIRELVEELGFGSEIKPIFSYKKLTTHLDQETRFRYVYYAVISDDPKITIDPNEVMDATWVNLKDLHKFNLNQGSKEIIKELVAKISI